MSTKDLGVDSRMRFTARSIVFTGLVAAVSLGAGVKPAYAFNVNQNNNFADLLNVLLGDTTGLSNFSGSVNGSSGAFGTFSGDPFGLGQGVALSTGNVVDLPGENTGDLRDNTDLSTPKPPAPMNIPGALFDTATLELSFDADATVEKLFFQYIFGSEEFLEFAGSIFNDFFTLELNGTNLALLDDSVGSDNFVRVNNLAASPSGAFSSQYVNNPAGPGTQTRLDGYTQPLTFAGDIITGTNTLKIQIADVSDPLLDSAVFIKAGTLGTRPVDPPEPPPTPPVDPPTPPVDPPEPPP
ncbi:MAG: PEP-CTERM sorting domain-containing protein, partial [Leptolyngbya sp. SIO1D8]|nr:PEP-CTERM sorting domain-containing protein [Leptolyngbya sp. SIO1D8]